MGAMQHREKLCQTPPVQIQVIEGVSWCCLRHAGSYQIVDRVVEVKMKFKLQASLLTGKTASAKLHALDPMMVSV